MKHTFDVDVAVEYGVSAALLLENVGFWVEHNRANRTNFYEGKYWSYNSRKALLELFPYFGEKQLRTATKTLVDAGLLETGNFNTNPYDRTLWYTLSDEGYSRWRNAKCTFGKKTNGNAQSGRPIPDINTDIKTDSGIVPSANASGEKTTSRVIRKEYGEYQNVRLTDEELAKLKQEFPLDWNDRIERLSEYIASKGDKYKNHLAVIRMWDKMDKKHPQDGKSKNSIPDDDPYAGYTYHW